MAQTPDQRDAVKARNTEGSEGTRRVILYITYFILLHNLFLSHIKVVMIIICKTYFSHI